MKIFFIATSLYIVYLMQVKFKATYDANLDTFRVEYLLGGAAVFALLTTFDYSVLEVWIMLYGWGSSRYPLLTIPIIIIGPLDILDLA